jgi:hypothetical protein
MSDMNAAMNLAINTPSGTPPLLHGEQCLPATGFDPHGASDDTAASELAGDHCRTGAISRK